MSGGGDAAAIAPGSIVSVTGANLSYHTASADPNQNPLPNKLGGTQVYFNGIPAPLMMVSPDKVNAQIPWELGDTTSINAFVRSESDDGSVVVTTPVAVTIVVANPGVYAKPNTDPSVGVVYHASSYATGIVSVDGTATAADTATVTINGRDYTYTVQSGDTVTGIRDALVNLINQDPEVTATPSGEFQRIILKARVQGPEGNGLSYAASASSTATVIMTAIGTELCCAAVANSPVTPENPGRSGRVDLRLCHRAGSAGTHRRQQGSDSDRLQISRQRTSYHSGEFCELDCGRQDGGCDLGHDSARFRWSVPGAASPQSGPAHRPLFAVDDRAGYLREQYCHGADCQQSVGKPFGVKISLTRRRTGGGTRCSQGSPLPIRRRTSLADTWSKSPLSSRRANELNRLSGGQYSPERAATSRSNCCDHLEERPGTAVIPAGDSFGGVAAAQETQADIRAIRLSAFGGDFNEQTAIAGCRRKARVCLDSQIEQLDPLRKRCTGVWLVWKLPGQSEHDFVYRGERRFR